MSYSLTITWTAASPAPANGYKIKYWPTSNPSSITTVTPNVSGTTHTITGLTETSYEGTVESSCGGGNYSTTVEFAASVPVNYYYTGLLCGGSIVESFTSTIGNLSDGTYVVKAFCSTCGGTVQCFDNISPTTTPTTNPVIDTFGDCSSCNSSI